MYIYIYICMHMHVLLRLYLYRYIWGLYLNVYVQAILFINEHVCVFIFCFDYIISHVHIEKKNFLKKKKEKETVVHRCSSKQVFLKISQISRESNCVGVSFNKVAELRVCNFIKKRLQHRCFPVKFAKFLGTPFFHRTPPVAASDFITFLDMLELFCCSIYI